MDSFLRNLHDDDHDYDPDDDPDDDHDDDPDDDHDGQQGPGPGLSASPIWPIKGLAAPVQPQPRVAKMVISWWW